MGLLAVAGGAIPVAAKLGNSFLVDVIVFVSFPAWGLALAVGNVLAAVVVLLVPFHAS